MLTEIIVNVYLVNNLRANILIRIDTIGPKGIDIITTKRHVYVTSYNIRILVNIKPRGVRVRRAVKVMNDILVKLDKQVIILVNYYI